jgi:L-ascorbate metabolism protein UlaG (beta-lactamase superfamily)
MRLKTLAALVSFALLTLNDVSHAQQPGMSVDTSPAWNDNSLIAVQKKGDFTRPGDVKIEFYGHDAFKITSPAGLTVLADPWRNDSTGVYPKWFLSDFPVIRVDIVLSTHAHFDHDAVERPKGLMVLERLVGQFKLGDIAITGLADKHQCDRSSADSIAKTCPPNNPIELDNAIQIIEAGGFRIVVWGDNRPTPDPSLDRYLENVDVLILPVETVLTRAEADAIIEKYNPRTVVPAHYFLNGLTADAVGLESADGWVNYEEKIRHAEVRHLNSADLTLNAAELKGAHHRVYYFGNHFEEK